MLQDEGLVTIQMRALIGKKIAMMTKSGGCRLLDNGPKSASKRFGIPSEGIKTGTCYPLLTLVKVRTLYKYRSPLLRPK